LGAAWESGRLDVRHEHFGSAVLGDFLRAVRMPVDERASGPIVALATLPGEQHGLGLQMAALVFALAEWRPLVLGVETPVPQILALVREAPIAAVALSLVNPSAATLRAVGTLRRRLPARVPMLVGGAGAARIAAARGVVLVRDLFMLDRWVRDR
jgi:cobalamin-dependent methionine synthase I